MPSTTPNLGLLKKDPIADGNDTFNIKTMMNDNWDAIDEKTALKTEIPKLGVSGGAAKQDDLTSHLADATKHITADERTAWNNKMNLGGANIDINLVKSLSFSIDTRNTQILNNADGTTTITEKDGVTAMKTANISTTGNVTTISESCNGKTVTTTINTSTNPISISKVVV